jgi:hypothetical protein
MQERAVLESIIQKSGLLIPDDFIVPDLDYIRRRVENVPGRESIDDKVRTFAKFVYKDKGISGTVPPGFNEDLSFSVIITSAASLAGGIPGMEPSISCVSDLIGKDRNFVAAFAKGLANGHLVDLREQKRGELIEPTLSGLAYTDLVIMNGAWTARALQEVSEELRCKARNEALEKLEDLEIAFHMAEKAYDRSTMNFKIMEELHQYATEALVNARKGKIDIALDKIAALVENLHVMSESKKKARKLGMRSAILEETGELGKARVFEVK